MIKYSYSIIGKTLPLSRGEKKVIRKDFTYHLAFFSSFPYNFAINREILDEERKLIKREYILGNEAIAYGLLEGGVEAAYGYPGTPSSEIMEKLIGLSLKYGFYAEWSVNEKVAFENAVGSSWGGRRATVIMKHVGLNVAADPFMTLAYTGTRGGFVLIVADDPSSHSSQNEQDSRRYANFARIPCLDPSSVQEAKEMASYAFELSEKFKTPVMLRSTTRISHAKSDVEIEEDLKPKENSLGEFEKDPSQWVMVPASARRLHPELNEKQKKIEEELESLPWNRLELSSSKIGVIASGISYLYTREAIDFLKIPVSLLKVGTYPPPVSLINELLERCEKVLIIEELEPVLEEFVRICADSGKRNLRIFGKLTGHIPREGELSVDIVKKALGKVSGRAFKRESDPLEKIKELLPPRPPTLCAGCPHRATFYAMKKVFGRNAIFPSDIGCYTLGLQMGTVDTCICMGASISIASGLYRSGEKRNIVCTIGDSTFLHTGLPGLLNAVYNRSNIVVVILDNGTTAMTGHQPHPATGITAQGRKTHQICLEHLVKAYGVDYVRTVDPYKLDELIQAFEEAKKCRGVRVIIAKRLCALLARKSTPKVKQFKVTESCTRCKRCLEIGCPALTWDGKKVSINEECLGCGVCAQICPTNSIKEIEEDKDEV